MLENLFLSYANNSFKEDPDNLRKVFNEIIPRLNPYRGVDKIMAENVIEFVISFAKDNDPQKANERRKKMMKEVGFIYARKLKKAFEVVYEYQNGYCPDECNENYGGAFNEILNKSEFKNASSLKCYECRQLHFINILLEIIEGKNYIDMIYDTIDEKNYKINKESLGNKLQIGDKIGKGFSLGNYFDKAYKYMGTKVVVNDNGKLEKVDFLDSKGLSNFNEFLVSIVGFSLAEFLLKKDRRKLKKCPFCNKFYIADDIRQKKCKSDDCKKAYERKKKQKQREKDPAKYY
jgi:hypothetical protein